MNRMPDLALDGLVELLMCDDPSRLEKWKRAALEQFADHEAQDRGFTSWTAYYVEAKCAKSSRNLNEQAK